MEKIYEETREGQTPRVQAAGNNVVVDWQQQPSAFSQASQVLGTIMQTLEQEDAAREKKKQEKLDMYKTLREAGYDTKSAYQAMQSGNLPSTPPGKTTQEEKDEADLEKTRAQTRKENAVADAYDRGDIGKRKAAADKMNAAQLQREIKRMSDPFENPDYESEETKSYIAHLNARLQQLAQYPGSEGAQPDLPAAPAGKPAQEGRVAMIRPDGSAVQVAAKDVEKALKKGYTRRK